MKGAIGGLLLLFAVLCQIRVDAVDEQLEGYLQSHAGTGTGGAGSGRQWWLEKVPWFMPPPPEWGPLPPTMFNSYYHLPPQYDRSYYGWAYQFPTYTMQQNQPSVFVPPVMFQVGDGDGSPRLAHAASMPSMHFKATADANAPDVIYGSAQHWLRNNAPEQIHLPPRMYNHVAYHPGYYQFASEVSDHEAAHHLSKFPDPYPGPSPTPYPHYPGPTMPPHNQGHDASHGSGHAQTVLSPHQLVTPMELLPHGDEPTTRRTRHK